MAPLHIFAGGCTLSLIAQTMKIVGIVTPSWYIVEDKFGSNNLNKGLCKICAGGTCRSIDHPTSSLKAVRALEIIEASATFVGLVLAFVFLVFLRRNVTTMKFDQFAFIAQLLAVLCSIIGAIVFRFDHRIGPLDDDYYSYSFYLNVAGGVFAILSAVLIAFAEKQMIAGRGSAYTTVS